MARTKDNNQYFGQLFEEKIAMLLNANIEESVKYDFLPEEIKEVESHASKTANFIKYLFIRDSKINCIYNARNTITTLGDLTVNKKSIELKYVGTGFGTYHNTSVNYFSTIGIKSYKDFLLEKGYYKEIKILLKDIPEVSVKEEALSPLSNSESKIIRKKYKNIYKQISSLERNIRVEYNKYFYEKLSSDSKLKERVLLDFIQKSTSSNSKGIPDYIIVYNWKNNKMKCLTKTKVKELINSIDNLRLTPTGIIYENGIRLQIGWQNGNGLNNPTIRCSLLKFY